MFVSSRSPSKVTEYFVTLSVSHHVGAHPAGPVWEPDRHGPGHGPEDSSAGPEEAAAGAGAASGFLQCGE